MNKKQKIFTAVGALSILGIGVFIANYLNPAFFKSSLINDRFAVYTYRTNLVKNLVSNGDFETDTAGWGTPWGGAGTFVSSPDEHMGDGAKSMKFDNSARFIIQNHTPYVGNLYRFHAWVKGMPASATSKTQVFNADIVKNWVDHEVLPRPLDTEYVSKNYQVIPGDDWQEISVDLMINENTPVTPSSLSVIFHNVNADADKRPVYVDKVSVELISGQYDGAKTTNNPTGFEYEGVTTKSVYASPLFDNQYLSNTFLSADFGTKLRQAFDLLVDTSHIPDNQIIANDGCPDGWICNGAVKRAYTKWNVQDESSALLNSYTVLDAKATGLPAAISQYVYYPTVKEEKDAAGTILKKGDRYQLVALVSSDTATPSKMTFNLLHNPDYTRPGAAEGYYLEDLGAVSVGSTPEYFTSPILTITKDDATKMGNPTGNLFEMIKNPDHLELDQFNARPGVASGNLYVRLQAEPGNALRVHKVELRRVEDEKSWVANGSFENDLGNVYPSQTGDMKSTNNIPDGWNARMGTTQLVKNGVTTTPAQPTDILTENALKLSTTNVSASINQLSSLKSWNLQKKIKESDLKIGDEYVAVAWGKNLSATTPVKVSLQITHNPTGDLAKRESRVAFMNFATNSGWAALITTKMKIQQEDIVGESNNVETTFTLHTPNASILVDNIEVINCTANPANTYCTMPSKVSYMANSDLQDVGNTFPLMSKTVTHDATPGNGIPDGFVTKSECAAFFKNVGGVITYTGDVATGFCELSQFNRIPTQLGDSLVLVAQVDKALPTGNFGTTLYHNESTGGNCNDAVKCQVVGNRTKFTESNGSVTYVSSPLVVNTPDKLESEKQSTLVPYLLLPRDGKTYVVKSMNIVNCVLEPQNQYCVDTVLSPNYRGMGTQLLNNARMIVDDGSMSTTALVNGVSTNTLGEATNDTVGNNTIPDGWTMTLPGTGSEAPTFSRETVNGVSYLKVDTTALPAARPLTLKQFHAFPTAKGEMYQAFVSAQSIKGPTQTAALPQKIQMSIVHNTVASPVEEKTFTDFGWQNTELYILPNDGGTEQTNLGLVLTIPAGELIYIKEAGLYKVNTNHSKALYNGSFEINDGSTLPNASGDTLAGNTMPDGWDSVGCMSGGDTEVRGVKEGTNTVLEVGTMTTASKCAWAYHDYPLVKGDEVIISVKAKLAPSSTLTEAMAGIQFRNNPNNADATRTDVSVVGMNQKVNATGWTTIRTEKITVKNDAQVGALNTFVHSFGVLLWNQTPNTKIQFDDVEVTLCTRTTPRPAICSNNDDLNGLSSGSLGMGIQFLHNTELLRDDGFMPVSYLGAKMNKVAGDKIPDGWILSDGADFTKNLTSNLLLPPLLNTFRVDTTFNVSKDITLSQWIPLATTVGDKYVAEAIVSSANPNGTPAQVTLAANHNPASGDTEYVLAKQTMVPAQRTKLVTDIFTITQADILRATSKEGYDQLGVQLMVGKGNLVNIHSIKLYKLPKDQTTMSVMNGTFDHDDGAVYPMSYSNREDATASNTIPDGWKVGVNGAFGPCTGFATSSTTKSTKGLSLNVKADTECTTSQTVSTPTQVGDEYVFSALVKNQGTVGAWFGAAMYHNKGTDLQEAYPAIGQDIPAGTDWQTITSKPYKITKNDSSTSDTITPMIGMRKLGATGTLDLLIDDVTMTSCHAFDEARYIKAYPEVQALITAKTYASGLEHYNAVGMAEDRLHQAKYKLLAPDVCQTPVDTSILATANQLFHNSSLTADEGKIPAVNQLPGMDNTAINNIPDGWAGKDLIVSATGTKMTGTGTGAALSQYAKVYTPLLSPAFPAPAKKVYKAVITLKSIGGTVPVQLDIVQNPNATDTTKQAKVSKTFTLTPSATATTIASDLFTPSEIDEIETPMKLGAKLMTLGATLTIPTGNIVEISSFKLYAYDAQDVVKGVSNGSFEKDTAETTIGGNTNIAGDGMPDGWMGTKSSLVTTGAHTGTGAVMLSSDLSNASQALIASVPPVLAETTTEVEYVATAWVKNMSPIDQNAEVALTLSDAVKGNVQYTHTGFQKPSEWTRLISPKFTAINFAQVSVSVLTPKSTFLVDDVEIVKCKTGGALIVPAPEACALPHTGYANVLNGNFERNNGYISPSNFKLVSTDAAYKDAIAENAFPDAWKATAGASLVAGKTGSGVMLSTAAATSATLSQLNRGAPIKGHVYVATAQVKNTSTKELTGIISLKHNGSGSTLSEVASQGFTMLGAQNDWTKVLSNKLTIAQSEKVPNIDAFGVELSLLSQQSALVVDDVEIIDCTVNAAAAECQNAVIVIDKQTGVKVEKNPVLANTSYTQPVLNTKVGSVLITPNAELSDIYLQTLILEMGTVKGIANYNVKIGDKSIGSGATIPTRTEITLKTATSTGYLLSAKTPTSVDIYADITDNGTYQFTIPAQGIKMQRNGAAPVTFQMEILPLQVMTLQRAAAPSVADQSNVNAVYGNGGGSLAATSTVGQDAAKKKALEDAKNKALSGGGSTTTELVCPPNCQTPQLLKDLRADHFATNAIQYLLARGVMKGYADNSFRPNNEINRAEFAKTISSGFMLKDEAQSTKLPFKDVRASDWFYPTVRMVYNAGIVKGYATGDYKPSRFIQRDEAVKMMAIMDAAVSLRAENPTLSFASAVTKAEGVITKRWNDWLQAHPGYSYVILRDVSVKSWYAKYFLYAAEEGYVTGRTIDGEKIFAPANTITRGEAATLIARIIDANKLIFPVEKGTDGTFTILSTN